MRFEAKTEADAVEQAARALQKSATEVRYRVVRDEKSFWGGRIVEIEVDALAPEEAQSAAERPVQSAEKIREEWTGARAEDADVEASVPGRSSRPRRSDPAP